MIAVSVHGVIKRYLEQEAAHDARAPYRGKGTYLERSYTCWFGSLT